jgi:hypothetical protein
MTEKSLPATHPIRFSHPDSTGKLKNTQPQGINTPIKKRAHELNREFSNEEVKWTVST